MYDFSTQTTEDKKERFRSYENNRNRHGNRSLSKIKRGVIAVDGEGETGKDNRHRYTLLAASTGSYISANDLSTAACLDFLCNLDNHYLIVGFSFGYDVSMILKDLDYNHTKRLIKSGKVYWKQYRLEYTPRRLFTVTDRKTKKHCRIYDVFGFYQCSFVKALETWKIGTAEQIKRIANMKDQRGTFSKSMQEQILEYCFEECRLLVQLVQKLAVSVDYLELKLQHWWGAGALATAMLQKHSVKKYHKPSPAEFKSEILKAYFGGRFEIAYTGEFENVYSYDINSAYPYAEAKLPCLTHMRMFRTKGYNANYVGLWKCQWSIDRKHPWTPFPVRTNNNTVSLHYPFVGEGWYHSSEVSAALRLHPNIDVLEGIVFVIECQHRPFEFIYDYYDYRQELKKQGNEAQYTIKLGLNSLYGKMAQGIGWKNKPPTYQNFVWAGMVTAGCRAMILDAISQNPSAILAVATDGILSSEPLQLPISKQLGEWEHAKYDRVFLVQPGIFQTLQGRNFGTKTRGFSKSSVVWENVKRDYYNNPVFGRHVYYQQQFIGITTATNLESFQTRVRQWVPIQREINFCPARRIPDTQPSFHELVETLNSREYLPPPPIKLLTAEPFGDSSREYKPKTTWDGQFSDERQQQSLERYLTADTP